MTQTLSLVQRHRATSAVASKSSPQKAAPSRTAPGIPTFLSSAVKSIPRAPGGRDEQEADRTAEAVMRAPDQRSRDLCSCGGSSGGAGDCRACRAARAEKAGAHVEGSLADGASTLVQEALRSSGQPLDASTRAFMEPRFGHDFSGVRVHTGEEAGASARAVHSLAYTVGNDVVFKDGEYSPGSARGRELIAHELTHVLQQRHAPSRSLLQGKPDEATEVAVQAPKRTCEEALDITEVFRGFMKTYPGAIDAMEGLTADQRSGYKDMLQMVLSKEGGVDVMKWKALSCKKINLDLLIGEEVAGAYFDHTNKTVGLAEKYVSKLTPALKDKDALLDIITVLAHEKRHATLGSSISVKQSALKGDPSESKAQNAAYRAEEILTSAEEIAVRRMALGEEYEVSEAEVLKIRRLSNMIRNWVKDDEFMRLRQLIIDKLRARYGFEGGCDNPLTVGVIHSMEKNRWFECDRANHTIYGKVPDGLKVCTDERHTFCKDQPSGRTNPPNVILVP
jgi:Domain of unknown function (DUF4157)